MGFFELFLIGIGLSMDAFAVAICKGLGMERINKRDTLLLALFFGGFQALMPLTGYLLGSRFASYIERWDHWIAFVLLAFIGGNMIRESRAELTGGIILILIGVKILLEHLGVLG